MATESARLELKESTGRQKKNLLDSNRPSHGRSHAARKPLTIFQLASSSRWTPRSALNTIHKTIYCCRALCAPMFGFATDLWYFNRTRVVICMATIGCGSRLAWRYSSVAQLLYLKACSGLSSRTSSITEPHSSPSSVTCSSRVARKKKSAIRPGGGKSQAPSWHFRYHIHTSCSGRGQVVSFPEPSYGATLVTPLRKAPGSSVLSLCARAY
jgi:hypothetical protein